MPHAQRFLLYAEQNYAYAILRPLQAAIRARGGEARWFLAGTEIETSWLRADERRLTSIDAVRAWRPDAVLVPGNMVPSFIPGLKVAVFHGFNVSKVTRNENRGHFNIRSCFDLYCTQGPNTTHGFETLAEKHGYFSVTETGWPALDPLFRSDAAASQDMPLPADDGRPTVLLCSTFTRSLSCAPHLLDTVRALRDTERWHWLVQFHPKMDPAIVNAYKALTDANLTYVETDNVLPLLRRADVMVCDTSSVMLMFIAQRKPVVTFRNQSQGARAHLLDITEPDQLAGAIETALASPPALMQAIDAYIDELHPYRDGNSSQRVLTAVDHALARNDLRPKPANLIRNLKERKKLGYWKP
ncbi:CDP-glycerol glycerophosphotransferase family protein [Alcanivorax sp. JB21]|uniref:CDP-glycerol glycerophosphotransferase family protein n=1 Tax=Alcanivorax limicola TaxID=2874102 RepID=UPI001CC065BD|nr:CDP-glycerol glycerophosphotransferase family protein [Alcanivorax limicola]MBZ2190298.1 CDP-glycerol glycerophosphotransferase family protein [Alcanivorax limicola]